MALLIRSKKVPSESAKLIVGGDCVEGVVDAGGMSGELVGGLGVPPLDE